MIQDTPYGTAPVRVAALAAEWFLRHLDSAPLHEFRMGRDARG